MKFFYNVSKEDEAEIIKLEKKVYGSDGKLKEINFGIATEKELDEYQDAFDRLRVLYIKKKEILLSNAN